MIQRVYSEFYEQKNIDIYDESNFYRKFTIKT